MNNSRALEDTERDEELLKAVSKYQQDGIPNIRLIPYTDKNGIRSKIVNMPVGLAFAYDSNYRIPDHIALINNALLDVATGKINRLIINMPPRHGKSELISKYFPAWYLLNYVKKQIAIATYEADFAASWANKSKEIVGTNANCEITPLAVCGKIPAKKFDLLIVDDPIKNIDEANSKEYKSKVWKWFNAITDSCLNDNASIVIIMSRWHDSDLTGRILLHDKQKHWTVIKLPAIALTTNKDILKRKQGEALWENRIPLSHLKDIESQLGVASFSLLYQQK